MGTVAAARRLGRSMSVLLAGILAFHAGWYLLLPFFAILFTGRRGLTPAEAGLLLATQSFTLLAGSLAGGWLADRFGRRNTMVGGLLVRAAGFWGLGAVSGMPALLVSSAVAGVGGGLFGPAAKAGIAALATPENQDTAFAARGIAANIGITVGPVLGGLLVRGPMGLLFGVGAGLHLALAGITWALYREEARPRGRKAEALGAVLADGPYLRFSLATVLVWALFAQLSIAVPLHARDVLGLESAVGLLWTASSLAIILLQFTVTRLASAHLTPMTTMAIGSGLLGIGLGLVMPARSFWGLLLAVLVFVVGEMLVMPTADSAVSGFAPAAALGSYFGIATVAWGMGEGVGNLIGGGLMQYALASGRVWLPWALYAAAGLAIGGLYLLLGRLQGPVRAPAPLLFPGDRSQGDGPGIELVTEATLTGRQEDD